MKFFDDYKKVNPDPAPAPAPAAPVQATINKKELENLTNAIRESILNDLKTSQEDLKRDILEEIKAGAPAEKEEPEKEE